jgi:hypothetical protein
VWNAAIIHTAVVMSWGGAYFCAKGGRQTTELDFKNVAQCFRRTNIYCCRWTHESTVLKEDTGLVYYAIQFSLLCRWLVYATQRMDATFLWLATPSGACSKCRWRAPRKTCMYRVVRVARVVPLFSIEGEHELRTA